MIASGVSTKCNIDADDVSFLIKSLRIFDEEKSEVLMMGDDVTGGRQHCVLVWSVKCYRLRRLLQIRQHLLGLRFNKNHTIIRK